MSEQAESKTGKGVCRKGAKGCPLPLSSILFFLVLCTGMIALWAYSLHSLRERQVDNAYSSLAAVVDLKLREIVRWRDKYQDYGESLMLNPAIAAWVKPIVQGGADEDRKKQVVAWLDHVVEWYDFQSALLVDDQVNVVLAATSTTKTYGQYAGDFLRRSLETRSVHLSDLHTAPETPEAHMDLCVPLLDGKAPVGAFLFRIDPTKTLYPMLHPWPIPGGDGEFALLRRDGGRVVYLNPLRYATNVPLQLVRSVSTPNMPEALAVLGMEGPIRGVDYRGVDVLAFLHAVPDSAWRIVAKMNYENVLISLRSQARLLTATGVALLNLAFLVLGFVWYRQKRDMALAQEREEAARKALTRHYMQLSRYANDMILLADQDGRIVEANDRCLRAYGYSREAILAMTLEKFWPPELQDECLGVFRQVRHQEQAVRFETTHCRMDGQRLPVEVTLRFIHESGLQYTQAVVQDISERILRRSLLERYQGIARHARDMILFVGQDGTILEVNDSAAKTYGYSQEELRRLNIRELRALSHMGDFAAQFAEALRHGLVFETMHRKKSGEAFPVEVSSTPISIGRERLLLSIIRDISTRRGVERALKVSEQNLRQVMDSVPQAIYVRDDKGRLILVNRRFAELCGKPAAELLDGAEAMPATLGKEMDDEVLRTQTPVVIPEEIWREPDGTIRLMQTSKYIFTPSGTGLMAVLSVSTDITEGKRLQEQLLHAQKMESVGRLAGGVAHEFNNMLQAIMGFSEILLAKMDDAEPSKEDVLEIHKAAKRAGALTAQLLAYSRKQVMDAQVRSLNEIIEGAKALLHRLLDPGVRLSLALDSRVPPIRVDAGQVDQILVNLVVNACDAMPGGGVVTIKTSVAEYLEEDIQHIPGARAGSFVCLSVGDTGVGMNADTKAHMFEPFYTTKAPGTGTGLGLSMVYGIVQQHGGWIDVFSDPGTGTVFWIYFPVAADTGSSPASPHKPQVLIPAELQRLTILVVEDDDAVRQFAARVLKEKGFRVFMCGSREEAYSMLRQQDGGVDLLFADIVLSDGNGIDLWKSMSADRHGMHVLLTSGYPDMEDRWPEVFGKPWPFLQKPYSSEALAQAVVQALKMPAAG